MVAGGQAPRPGFGRLGRAIRLLSNYFRISCAAERAVVYRVDITGVRRSRRGGEEGGEEPPPRRERGAEAAKLPREKAHVVMAELARQQQWVAGWAYDDQNTLVWPAYYLDQAEHEYEVSASFPDRPAAQMFKVVIKWVSTVDLAQVNSFCRGQQGRALPRDALQALDIVLRHAAASRPGVSVLGAGLFFDQNAPRIPIPQFQVELWEGFRQLLKPTGGGLSLNLSQAAAVMHQPMPVITFLQHALRLRTPEELVRQFTEDRRFRYKAAKFINGMQVHAKFEGAPPRRYRVKGFTDRPANQLLFPLRDESGQTKEITVEQYYYTKYQRRLRYPGLPCLEGRPKGAALPMELFELVPGQRLRKVGPELLSQVGNYTIQEPERRLNTIAQLVDTAQLRSSTTMRAWGMDVDTSLAEVQGRVLPTAPLQYGGRGVVDPGTTGAWNLRNVKMLQGAVMHSWAVVSMLQPRDAGGPADDFGQQRFVAELADMLEVSGVMLAPNAKRPPILPHSSGGNNLNNAFRAAAGRAQQVCGKPAQMLLVLIDRRDVDLYREIKNVGDSQLGIITQVVTADKAGIGPRNYGYKARGRPQYCANVALKVNMKMGGRNVRVGDPLPKLAGKKFMLIGADLTHPTGFGSTEPSVAAICCTMDADAAQYATRVVVQPNTREDVVQDMRPAMVELLQQYQRINKALPEVLLMYRDGVSEGQFAVVLEKEFPAIKQACTEVGGAQYNPPLTYVSVQKRHSTRFFPMQDGDADPKGNLLPGTVVDRDVCHPWAFDFFLVAHAALNGTTRPTHYSVLVDEIGFGADELQALTYRLCYLYCRCTRSVSLVPPAYYADLAAARGRMMCRMSDTMSETSSLQSGETGFAGTFGGIHGNITNRMYFV